MIKKMQLQWLSIMAHVHVQQRQFHSAVTLLEAAAVLQPKNIDVNKALAFAYLNDDQPSECFNLIEIILKSPLSQHDKHHLYQMKGQALWKMKDTSKASIAFVQSRKYAENEALK